MKINSSQKILISGHRGDPVHYPENTILSFRSAVEMGADMLETDVRATKDGVIVLMHDANTVRTTGYDGNVSEMTLAQIKELYVGDSTLKCRVPTLEEFLTLFAPRKELLLNIELKYTGNKKLMEYTLDKTVEMCRKHDVCNRVMINSFDFYILKYCKEKYGDEFILHGFYPYTHMHNVEADPAEYLDYACFWASGDEAKAACNFLISKGIEPCSGSKTPEVLFYELAGYGCSMFTENDPESAIKWRNKMLPKA